ERIGRVIAPLRVGAAVLKRGGLLRDLMPFRRIVDPHADAATDGALTFPDRKRLDRLVEFAGDLRRRATRDRLAPALEERVHGGVQDLGGLFDRALHRGLELRIELIREALDLLAGYRDLDHGSSSLSGRSGGSSGS